jgi:hypothetical protein
MKLAGDKAGCRDLKLCALRRLVAVAASATSPLSPRVNCVRHLKYGLAFLVEEDLPISGSDKGAMETLVGRSNRHYRCISDCRARGQQRLEC